MQSEGDGWVGVHDDDDEEYWEVLGGAKFWRDSFMRIKWNWINP